MNTNKSLAITSLNILDGLNHHRNWALLQVAWDSAGMGFVEFCGWITDIAQESENELAKRDPQDFPGVYDYEVSFSLGQKILEYVIDNKTLPEKEQWGRWLIMLIDEFFTKK